MNISAEMQQRLVEGGHLISIHGRRYISLEALEPYDVVPAQRAKLETQDVKPDRLHKKVGDADDLEG